MKKRWKKLYETQETIICPYCMKPIKPDEITKDHLVPVSRQGSRDKSNIVFACKRCNNEKGALTPEEYAEWKRLNFIRCGGLNHR